MSCKSAVYAVNFTPQDVAVDGVINLGYLSRAYGDSFRLANGLELRGAGYYDVSASITLDATAAGDVTVTLYSNGIAVPGATATQTATAAGDTVNLSIVSLIRVMCHCQSATLTLVLSDVAATVTNVALVAEKL